MSSTALKLAAAISFVLFLLLSLIAYRVYDDTANKAQRAEAQAARVQEQTPQVMAVVAIKPLAAYKPIARESLALVPVAVAPAQYFTDLAEVTNRVPLVDIDAGAPVTARYFKEGNVLARIIPSGFQAVSVEVNDVVAVGGFVRPGDIVDVLLYLRGGAGVDEPQSRVLLREARVLAYEERIIDRPEGLKDEEKPTTQQRRVRTAVLAVPQADTTRVMLGASLGELRLALHGNAEPEPAQAATTAAALALEKPVKISELARVKSAAVTPAAPKPEARPPPAPAVEVYRGSQKQRVITGN